jgi:hypothetical protein
MPTTTQISFNEHTLSDKEIEVRCYNADFGIVVEVEQSDSLLYMTFDNEEQFKKYVFELASVFGKVVSHG